MKSIDIKKSDFFSKIIALAVLCGNNFTFWKPLQSKAEVERVLYLVSSMPSSVGRQYVIRPWCRNTSGDGRDGAV